MKKTILTKKGSYYKQISTTEIKLKNAVLKLSKDRVVVYTEKFKELTIEPLFNGETIVVNLTANKNIPEHNGIKLEDENGLIVASRIFYTGYASLKKDDRLTIYWSIKYE